MEQYMYGVIYGVVGERLSFDRPNTEPPVRSGTLATILNELTARGWEFVSMAAPGNQVVCILRRQKQQAPPQFPGQ